MRLVAASIVIAGIKLACRAGLFIAMLIVSRTVSPSDFGAYAYVLSFFAVISVVGGLGLEQAALLSLGRARASADLQQLDGSIASIFRRGIRILPLLPFTAGLFIYVMQGVLVSALMAVLTGLAIVAQVVVSALLRGLDHPIACTAVLEASRGPAFVLGALPLLVGGSLQSVWIATTLISVAFVIVGAAIAGLKIRDARRHCTVLDGSGEGGMVGISELGQFRFMLVLLASNAFVWLCPIILEWRAGVEEVGRFSVAMQYPSLLSFLATSLEAIYLGKIAASWHAGTLRDIQPMIRTGSWLVLIVGAPMVAVLVLLGPQLLGLFGADYVSVWPAMLIVLAAQAANTACGSAGYLVLLTGRVRLNLAVMVIANAAGILFLLFFAATGGHVAAAIAFLISMVTSNVFLAVYSIRKLAVDPTLMAAFRPLRPVTP